MLPECEASRERKERLVASSPSSSRSTLCGGAAEAAPATRFSRRAASCAAKEANSLIPSTGGFRGGYFPLGNSGGRGQIDCPTPQRDVSGGAKDYRAVQIKGVIK
jgi:hypothetical protein